MLFLQSSPFQPVVHLHLPFSQTPFPQLLPSHGSLVIVVVAVVAVVIVVVVVVVVVAAVVVRSEVAHVTIPFDSKSFMPFSHSACRESHSHLLMSKLLNVVPVFGQDSGFE